MEKIIFACISIPVLDWRKPYLTNIYIYGCLIDHVCIKNTFLYESFTVNVIKDQNIFLGS